MERQTKSVILEAADTCISGLLCIIRVENIELNPGELYSFPERQGCWYLFGLSGSNVQMMRDGRQIHLQSGNAVALSANSSTAILPSAGGVLQVVCLQGEVADSLLQECRMKGGLCFTVGSSAIATMFGALWAEQEHRGSVSAISASAAAYQMLAKLYGNGNSFEENKKQIPVIVESALRILQEDFAFLEGVSELADCLEVTQEYLTRTFRKYVGIPPGKYLIQLKIEYAKLLLRQGQHSIAFVADACGFANPNYFAKVFRTMVGLNPAQYRKNHEKSDMAEDPMLDPFYVL